MYIINWFHVSSYDSFEGGSEFEIMHLFASNFTLTVNISAALGLQDPMDTCWGVFDFATPINRLQGCTFTAGKRWRQNGPRDAFTAICRLCTMELYNMGPFEAEISPMIIVYSWN